MADRQIRGKLRRLLGLRKPAGKNYLPRLIDLFRRNTLAVHSAGNLVALFENGAAQFQAMLVAIGQARSEIVVEFYIIHNDRAGDLFAAALIAAAKRGVRVYLLYDFVGCFSTAAAYFERLTKGGVQCLAFNPPSFHRGYAWFDKRNHRKILIVDGETAFTGSMNIGDEYIGRNQEGSSWRDVGVRIAGPAAEELGRLFRELWAREHGTSLSVESPLSTPLARGKADVQIVSGGPHFTRSHIRNAFRLAFASADLNILIMTSYFLPGPRFLRSLIRAARRGVRVVLVLPAEIDVPLVRLISRSLHGPLLAAGIELYERQGAILHAKVMAVDDSWGMVGSANLDLRSFHRNFEVNLVVHDRQFGQQLAALINKELLSCHRVQQVEHEDRGVTTRLFEKLLKPVAWFL